jgi:NADH:ubiquinone reductase (H+-translocating)
MLAEATGASTDRAGRVAVRPGCSLPGHPEVFAIGDMVSLNDLPAVAQPAIQEGSYVGRLIRARLAGQPGPPPFAYRDKGSMATIGHLSAVTDSYGMKFTGVTGYTMWGFVHVLYLVGWANRIAAILSWARALTFTKNRPHRTITAEHVHDELTSETEHPSRLRGAALPRKPRWRAPDPAGWTAPALRRSHVIRSAGSTKQDQPGQPFWPAAIPAGDNARKQLVLCG